MDHEGAGKFKSGVTVRQWHPKQFNSAAEAISWANKSTYYIYKDDNSIVLFPFNELDKPTWTLYYRNKEDGNNGR